MPVFLRWLNQAGVEVRVSMSHLTRLFYDGVKSCPWPNLSTGLIFVAPLLTWIDFNQYGQVITYIMMCGVKLLIYS